MQNAMDAVRQPSIPRKTRRLQIIASVREHTATSRTELSREMSLDKKAMSVIVDGLLSDGILAISGHGASSAGRRRELLSLNGQYANCIGIDLGGTHMTGLLCDFAGTVLDRAFFEIRPGLPVSIILDQMKTIARQLHASGRATAKVRAAGVGVPGFVQPDRGLSIVAENIQGWRDVPIGRIMEEELSLPVVVDDSSRAYATAERWLGYGKGRADFLLLDLGYGVGMGIFAAGALYTGADWRSGEIGHVVMAPDGEPCACGNRGCLETVASGRAIARQAAEGIRRGDAPLLQRLTHNDPDAVTAQDVSIAASMADPFSIGLLESAGRSVGLALANAVNILNPSAIVLGGGLLGAGKTLTNAIAGSLARFAMPGLRERLSLVVSELGADGAARGMALAAADRIMAET